MYCSLSVEIESAFLEEDILIFCSNKLILPFSLYVLSSNAFTTNVSVEKLSESDISSQLPIHI